MNVLHNFSLVDIVALVVIAIGGLQGFMRGLSGELARLAGAILAFMAGTLLNEPIGQWVLDHTRLEAQAARTFAFVLTVISAILIMLVLRMVFRKLITLVFARGFDKTAGVVAGLARMSILVCLFVILMNLVPSETLNRMFGHESAVGRLMIRYVPTVENTLEAAGINTFRQQSDPEDAEATGNAP